MSKKLLAIALATTMVMGSTVSAFASEDSTTPGTGTALAPDSTAVEGTGSEEGLVNTRLYRVTLPVIPATSLNYTIDPQGLIKKTNAAAYDGIEVGDGNLFFVNHETLNATTEGTKTGLSADSDEFSLVNKSTFPIKVTVTTKATAGTAGTNVLVPGISATAVPTNTDVALVYSDNATKSGEDALLLTNSDQTPAAVLGDASAAYQYGYASNAYTYTFDADGTYDFATLKFKFSGAVTVDDTKTGSTLADWTIKTAATASADEVRYASISAPKISVKYKLDEYTVKEGEADYQIDIAGPGGGESATEAGPSITGTSFKYTSGQALEIPVSLGSGSLKATGVNRITYVNSSGVSTALATTNWSYANNKITIAESYITALAGANVTRDYKVTFDGETGTATQVTINLHP